MTDNYEQLRELPRGGERTKHIEGEHRAENSLSFLVAAGNEELLRAIEGAEGRNGLTAESGVLRAVVRAPSEKRSFAEALYLQRLQEAAWRLGWRLEAATADSAGVSDGSADVELWEQGSNFLREELLHTRKPHEGTVVGKPFFTESWYAKDKQKKEFGLQSFKGLWSEIQLFDDGDRGKLLDAGVKSYVIIDNDSFVRYNLGGSVLERKTLTLTGKLLTITDECGNSVCFEVVEIEGLGGFKLISTGSEHRVTFLRPWLDHTYEVSGVSASGRRLGPFFAGICDGVATWRFEDGNLGCVCGVSCEDGTLTWDLNHTDAFGKQSGSSKKGTIVFNNTGFSWMRENGERLDFVRTFDGVWRCPGWNTFCLSSLGNVKVFKNYQKKYCTPVVYVSDYESCIVTEHYLSGKKLSYITQFLPGSQIMDGIDGNDLGRRFVNLNYYSGAWSCEDGETPFKLTVSRDRILLESKDIEHTGKIYSNNDIQIWFVDGVETYYVADITGLDSFSLSPLGRPEELLRFRRILDQE